MVVMLLIYLLGDVLWIHKWALLEASFGIDNIIVVDSCQGVWCMVYGGVWQKMQDTQVR